MACRTQRGLDSLHRISLLYWVNLRAWNHSLYRKLTGLFQRLSLMVGLACCNFATILGRLVAFVTWLAEHPGDEHERQEQKWQKKSERNAWAEGRG